MTPATASAVAAPVLPFTRYRLKPRYARQLWQSIGSDEVESLAIVYGALSPEEWRRWRLEGIDAHGTVVPLYVHAHYANGTRVGVRVVTGAQQVIATIIDPAFSNSI